MAGYPIVPAYGQLLEHKPDLRPSGTYIAEDGSDAQAPMQKVLDHTVNRLLKIPKVVQSLDEFEQKHVGHKIEYLCYFKGSSMSLTNNFNH